MFILTILSKKNLKFKYKSNNTSLSKFNELKPRLKTPTGCKLRNFHRKYISSHFSIPKKSLKSQFKESKPRLKSIC